MVLFSKRVMPKVRLWPLAASLEHPESSLQYLTSAFCLLFTPNACPSILPARLIGGRRGLHPLVSAFRFLSSVLLCAFCLPPMPPCAGPEDLVGRASKEWGLLASVFPIILYCNPVRFDGSMISLQA